MKLLWVPHFNIIMLTPYELILKKQQNTPHSKEEIQYIISNYLNGNLEDYHISAWLMAVYFNGMDTEEVNNYTKSIINSGKILSWGSLNGPIVDKHSTGGVGDKVSIALAPILAACGCFVPMVVGRGLGHTGGTLDKLESIPGYNGMIDCDRFIENVKNVGCSIIGQIEDICPADLKLYNLRDQTATINSNPLICGSIMSKKIAEGIDALILDIKVGNGAFMKNLDNAKTLSNQLEAIALDNNIKIKTIFSDMNQVLGNTAGLYCEILESIEILKGRGPADLKSLVVKIADECMQLTDSENSLVEINTAITSGKAYEIFLKMVNKHGCKIREDLFSEINKPKFYKKIISKNSGYLGKMDTFNIGMGLIKIGAGRKSIADIVDPTAGITLNSKIGDQISTGDEIGIIFNSNESKLNHNIQLFENCFTIEDMKPKSSTIIVR